MTDQDKRDLSERIALSAEAAGIATELLWDTAKRCPVMHDQQMAVEDYAIDCTDDWIDDWGWQIQALCLSCITNDAELMEPFSMYHTSYHLYDGARKIREEHTHDVAWHPEWRIGRVAKDLTDPANLLTVVEAWRQQRPLRSWRMTSRLDAEIKCNAYAGVSEVPDGFIKVETLRNGSTPWEALALAFAEALEKEETLEKRRNRND